MHRRQATCCAGESSVSHIVVEFPMRKLTGSYSFSGCIVASVCRWCQRIRSMSSIVHVAQVCIHSWLFSAYAHNLNQLRAQVRVLRIIFGRIHVLTVPRVSRRPDVPHVRRSQRRICDVNAELFQPQTGTYADFRTADRYIRQHVIRISTQLEPFGNKRGADLDLLTSRLLVFAWNLG